jgi:hypothetical protein
MSDAALQAIPFTLIPADAIVDTLRAIGDERVAARRAAVWASPHIADADIPVALNIPERLWRALKAQGDTPPLFEIGPKRVHVLTSELLKWVTNKGTLGLPGTQKQRKEARLAQARVIEAERHEHHLPKRYRTRTADQAEGARE